MINAIFYTRMSFYMIFLVEMNSHRRVQKMQERYARVCVYGSIKK